MDRKLIAILVVGGLVIGITPWLAWPTAHPPPAPADRRYLHCPKCLAETVYSEKAEEQGCKRCGPDGPPLVATKESLKQTGIAPGPWASLLPWLLVESVLLLAAVLAYVTWFKQSAATINEEDYLYTHCAKCTQKLRYHKDKVGRAGVCPRCRRGLVFPPPEPDDLAGKSLPWWKRGLAWLSSLMPASKYPKPERSEETTP
ncbi:MAG: hypothetical protein K2W96_22210 [Gemmataceae bacterium]|nr:hypothetical protein [Gemmataceae bacterium]